VDGYYLQKLQPQTLNTDKHFFYGHAISRLKEQGKLHQDVQQRQVKYLNNSIESDHAPIKKKIAATGGFKSQKRALSMIQGFESLRMLNKGQLDFWSRTNEPRCFHEYFLQ
jgi:transposase-like protein